MSAPMMMTVVLLCTIVVTIVSSTAAAGDALTTAEQDQLNALLAKERASLSNRPRRAATQPEIKTSSGNILLAVENGKKVGYTVGGDTIYFNDLPDNYQKDDAKCFSALKIGYELGQSSPSTNGVITMIKTSLADSTANLAKQVDDSVAAADKKIDGSLRDTETEVKKAVADSTKCNTNGFALKDGGGCTAAPWVVASADNLACSSANIGGLRYDQKAGGILVCSKDQKWTAVAPPSLGAFKTSGAKGCDTIKKAGFDAGNKLYWLHPSGAKDPFLVWCDMSGDGKPIHDGSSKERPATSCLAIHKYYNAVPPKAAKFWIGGQQAVCQLLSSGFVTQFGDGKTKDFPASDCQFILTNFGGLKSGEKRWLFPLAGTLAQTVCQISADGKTAYAVKTGESPSQAAKSCADIKKDVKGVKSGNFYVLLGITGISGTKPYKVYCEMEFRGGGYMMIYHFHEKTRSSSEWWLNFKTATTIGKNFQANDISFPNGKNYLLPIHHWDGFNGGEMVIRSQQADNNQAMTLKGFQVDRNNRFSWTWKSALQNGQTSNGEIGSMNHHRGAKLSTSDYDGDGAGQHCASTARSIGWFNSCCNLCMTANGSGSWRNKGRRVAWGPVDWHYRGTLWMVWLIK